MKVGVIGAGPSGLTTIKQLRDEGHDVVCLEKSGDIGGIWYRHDGDADEMKVFDDMQLTISQKLMAFSDFMLEERIFPDRKGYLQYLHAYAEKFGLRQHVRLNATVDCVEKSGDQWRVTVSANGDKQHHTFDALAVCSGPSQTPNKNVPHLEKFSGEVIHSSRYRNNRKFRGKRVLVVGLAESGADIVRQISDVAAECTLAVRSHTFLLPRLFGGRYSTDSYTVRAHHYEMYVRATDRPFHMKSFFEDESMSRGSFMDAIRHHGMQTMMSKVASMFDLKTFAMNLQTMDPVAAISSVVAKAVAEEPMGGACEPNPRNPMGQPLYPLKIDMFAEGTREVIDYINEWNRKSHNYQGCYAPRIIICKNVTFVPNILNGKIQVNDSGIESIEGNTVYFKDHTIKEYDYVVLATGFERHFSFFRGVEVPENNVRNLYKHAFHPDHDGRLALIGFVRPYTGGIPICAEMQARYFALLCSGKLRLPADVKDRIREDRAWEETFSDLSPRHSEATPSQLLFLDALAKEIGCLPTCKDLVQEPELLTKLWFHTFNQSCYRLTGPHAMPAEARESLLKEELPGRKLISAFIFMARSLWPSSMHPKDQEFVYLKDQR